MTKQITKKQIAESFDEFADRAIKNCHHWILRVIESNMYENASVNDNMTVINPAVEKQLIELKRLLTAQVANKLIHQTYDLGRNSIFIKFTEGGIS